MRACWAAMPLVLVQPSPASRATCRGTSVVPRVLALTHRHLHRSPCVRQRFVEISGSIAFSSLWFLSRKLCPIFVCQFKGSLQSPSSLWACAFALASPESRRGIQICYDSVNSRWGQKSKCRVWRRFHKTRSHSYFSTCTQSCTQKVFAINTGQLTRHVPQPRFWPARANS
jgi:hypothetical protein